MPARGQATKIAGTVVDSATRAPLPAALVMALEHMQDSGANVATDRRGNFQLTGINPGQFVLVITRIGYTARRIDLFVPAGADVRLELALQAGGVVLDPVQVTASRAPETTLDAPLSVSVVGRREITERAAFTPADHLRDVVGMDFASTGLVHDGFAVRGRNGANQGFLLMMADHRNAALPSLGSNVSVLLPFTNEDLERIEVVRGPGAALYGPDAHRGVVHFVTRSPFASKGAALSLSGGGRAIRQATARVAAEASARLAVKVSGDYLQGSDWELPAADDTLRPDHDVRRAGGEARIDWRVDSATSIIGSVGVAQAFNLLVPSGAGPVQARNWRYTSAQARLERASMLLNATYNVSDAGSTYQLRNGEPIVDNSRQVAMQFQRGASVGGSILRFGLDGRWTDPRTGQTIHGANEDDDRVAEVGGYVQARTQLSGGLDLVTALRVDRNSRLDDLSVSPRAGLVFRSAQAHVIRLTYNRAFSAPDPAQLFQDMRVQASLRGMPFGVRLSSIPRSGYTFRRDCAGICMRSPFDPAGPPNYRPADATLMWDSVVAILARPGPDSYDLSDVPVPSSSQVATVLGALNRGTGRFDRVTEGQVRDFTPLRRSFTQSLELGYRGVLGGRFAIAADAYVSRIEDPFGNPFAATPNVFHDSTTLAQYLGAYRPAATADRVAGIMSRIPVAIISPTQTSNPYDVLVLQRQGGAYTTWGVDASIVAALAPRWEVTATYSWFSHNVVRGVPVVGDVFLSVPQHKTVLSARYHHDSIGLSAALKGRAIGAFPVRTAASTGYIGSYALLDAHLSYELPGATSIAVSLDALNFLDHRHREIAGGAYLGRVVVSRVQLRL